MGKKKTFTVQFVDQTVSSIQKLPMRSPIPESIPLPRRNTATVIKRGAILPLSLDDDDDTDTESLQESLIVELSSERAIPACINRSQFIALKTGDRVRIPVGSKVRFDSSRNQVVLLEGVSAPYPVPQGFVLVFSDTLHFGREQSIRFTNCAGFVPVGSSFKVSAYRKTESTFSMDEIKEDLLSPIEVPTIITIN